VVGSEPPRGIELADQVIVGVVDHEVAIRRR
jgi:hypothetical protein